MHCEMDPVVKLLWTTALRSGEYNRWEGQLRSFCSYGSCFCPEGILVDLAVKAGITSWTWCNNLNHPPRVVMDWAGLSTFEEEQGFPVIVNHSVWGEQAIAGLNDVKGLSFAEIADVIDECL